MMWHTWGWGAGGWAGWLLMAVAMVVFWGALIALAIWAVRSLGSNRADQSDRKPNRAMEILEERYARGEIDRQELEERRAVLQGKET